MYLMEHGSGTRPYIMEWYDEVYLPTYGKLIEPNYVIRDGKRITERMIGLSTKQLSEATFEIQGKVLGEAQIRDTYLKPLFNENFINSYHSECDRRGYISFPLISLKKIQDYTKKDESCNSYNSSKLRIIESTIYSSKQYLKSWIHTLLEIQKQIGLETKIISHHNKELNIDELVEEYYPNPQDYFDGVNLSFEPLPVYYSEGKYPIRMEIVVEACQKHSEASDFPPKCYRCDSSDYNTKGEYDHHYVTKHPGLPGYPGPADLKESNLTPQGMPWES